MRKNKGARPRVAMTKSVSNRHYNFSTEHHIEALKQIRLKKKSESKVNWAVNAFMDWRNDRLQKFKYNFPIYSTNLLELETLTKVNLIHSLCRFIPEVTKKKVTAFTLVECYIR